MEKGNVYVNNKIMEERASLRLVNLHKKAFSGFNFRTATKLDDLMFQRQQVARKAYVNIEEDNAQLYFDTISAIEGEIKKLLNID